jgi:hypothetical protein
MTMKNNSWLSLDTQAKRQLCSDASSATGGKMSPQHVMLCVETFGHLFDFNLYAVIANCYVLSGKPALNADAMVAAVRRSGLMRWMRVSFSDGEKCTIQSARTDEPEDIVHETTVTWAEAEVAGYTRNPSWKRMGKLMLKARAKTALMRDAFPDVVCGIYSPDELADNMRMSDDERYAISAQSLGEEVVHSPSRGPASYTDDDYSTGADAETMTKRDADRPFTNIPF